MTSKVTFVILTASLLLQCIQHVTAKPQHDPKVIEELNDITEAFTSFENEKPLPRVQLKIAIMHERGPLFNFTIHRGKEVLQNVLKDSEMPTNPSVLADSELAEFAQFVEIVETIENSTVGVRFFDVVQLANRFQTLVEKYDTTSLTNPSRVELAIEAALKKHGLPKLKADFNTLFMDTVPQFNAKIDAYLDSLTPEQRSENKKLSEWYETFKDEQDVEKKRQIFDEYA